MLTLDKIFHAEEILKGIVRTTDVLYAPTICPGVDLYLKAENLQTTGSFKLRGAYNKITLLKDSERQRGVIACSAGNHAQGVALAASKNKIPSVICLPSGAPRSKINATRAYGAEVILVDGVYDDAYNYALSLQQENGYSFIHPFDDEDVIAGQGTVALEVMRQVSNIDAIVIPVGGGGLASGCAYAVKMIDPRIKVYGVQAEKSASMLASIREGRIVEFGSSLSIADGIMVKKPGRITHELCSRYLDDIVTVSEEEIIAAIITLLERCKMLVEGAGAASLAAVIFGKINLEGKRTVCIITGGNMDLDVLGKIIQGR